VNRFLQLFRLGNGLMGIAGVLASAVIASGLGIGDHVQALLLSFLVVIAFIAGGNSINDYVDRDIDVAAHPERPIPSGRMKPETALYVGCSALGLSLALSLLLWDVLSTSIVIAACTLMLAYELVLKQRGFVGNLTIGLLTGMVFLLGGAVVGNVEGNYIVAAMAFLVSVGREISKDIEDMDSDRGRSTLPMRVGKGRAGALAAAFFVSGPVLSLWPMYVGTFGYLYFTVLIADAIFIYAALILFKDPHRAQKYAKYAMLVALAAFILGAIS